jgi:dihydrofolate synthase / folylpolyglutamate synthase
VITDHLRFFAGELQMTYPETIAYLFSRLPMYHRIGAAAYKADLTNTHALCDLLGHPEEKFRSIHVAGTNGKGSTSHMLAAILQTAGYKTGLYTSPHLKDFRERIRIDGAMIPEAEVTSFVENNQKEFDKIDLSFFEWTVGLCFDYFAREKVDIAVIETGLGGRLDSTNLITPEISLITNISFDHTGLLGNTLEAIAREKAGIIKKGVPVVIGEENNTTKNIFIQRAADLESTIYFPAMHARIKVEKATPDRLHLDVEMKGGARYKNLELDLTGEYQVKNIAGVLETVRVLKLQGWKITDENVYTALKDVKALTGLMGRWQRISERPLTICDVAHNEAGIREVVRQLARTPHSHLHFVLGMVNDKDVASILALLPKDATYYFCKAAIPRALDAAALQEEAEKFQLKGNKYSAVRDALNAAQEAAAENEIVFVGGSTFVVAEAL